MPRLKAPTPLEGSESEPMRTFLLGFLIATLAMASIPQAAAIPSCGPEGWGTQGVRLHCLGAEPAFYDGSVYCGRGFRESTLWCGVSYDSRDGVDVRVLPSGARECVYLLYNLPTGGEHVVFLGCY